jgi:glucosamine kinase
MPWSALLRSLFAKFQSDPHTIVHWMTGASPKDFATFAPEVVEHALSLVGGLAASIEPWLADATRHHLVAPRGDAVAGALQLARNAAESLARGRTAPGRSR